MLIATSTNIFKVTGFRHVFIWCWMDLGQKLVNLYPLLRRYALSLTKNIDLAEDLVMEVITKILERATDIKEGTNMQSYAVRAVKNKFIDEKRSSSRTVVASSMDTEEQSFLDSIIDERAEFIVTARLEMRDLSRALSAISNDCLEILTLFGFGTSYKEIAKILDIAIGTVMSRMARCRTRLIEKLEEV